MMDVGALQAHVVEDRREAWIRGGINYVVRYPRIVCSFITEAHAVALQRGSREQMDTISQITLVLERACGAAPQRSVATPSGTEHIELLTGALALFDNGDVFGEEDLDRAIRRRATREDNAENGRCVLGCHNQPQSSGVLNGQVNVGGADSGLRACGRRPDHPPDGQNCTTEARRRQRPSFILTEIVPQIVP